ncbi:MAG: hypothetical protein RR739_05660, partial [Clostridia bacterium]
VAPSQASGSFVKRGAIASAQALLLRGSVRSFMRETAGATFFSQFLRADGLTNARIDIII